ncbi:MAG: transposase [Bullifex sp.]
MYFGHTVRIPDEHIVKIRNKDTVYVYWEKSREYIGEKKYTAPKRVCIGKEDPSSPGFMYPNNNFMLCFPEEIIPEEKHAFERSCALRIGMYLVIRKISSSMGITELLESVFGRKDAGIILDLAAYSIVTEGNAAQYYPDYAYSHSLFTEDMTMYSDSTVSRFLQDMDMEKRKGFLDGWNSSMDHRRKIYISYDSTNKNSQAGELEMVEYGKPKDDRGLPIFGYSIAYDSTNSIPLFYEEYPGSIVDISQLEFMMDKAKAYDYKNATFILDRGYFSKNNIRYMEEKGYGFILMVKGLHDLTSSLIDKRMGTFEKSRNCYIRRFSLYGTTVKSKIYGDDTKESYFHIFHSSWRESQERSELERKLDAMADSMEKHKGTHFRFSGTYETYYNLTYAPDGTFLMYKEKSDIVENELRHCGYFTIVTSASMTAEEAVTIYKSRDENEKLFRGDKSYLGDKSMRVTTDERMSSKIFIEFIALIIRCRFYTYLRDKFKDEGSRPNWSTVPAALRELEKIEMAKCYDGIYRLDHAVTKKQKEILSAFGISNDDVKLDAKEIGTILTIQKRKKKEEDD